MSNSDRAPGALKYPMGCSSWSQVFVASMKIPRARWPQDLNDFLCRPRPTSLQTPVRSWKKNDWPQSAHVPASEIRKALIKTSKLPMCQGLVLEGVYILGTLDLRYLQLSTTMSIRDSQFECELLMDAVHLPSLSIEESQIPGISLEGATLEHNLELNGSAILAPLHACQLSVGGQLQMEDVHVRAIDDLVAVDLQKATLNGGAFLSGLHSDGCLHAPYADISGQLNLENAFLKVKGFLDGQDLAPIALNIQHTKILGGVFLGGATVWGSLHGHSAFIDGPFLLKTPGQTASTLITVAKNQASIIMQNMNVSGNVDFSRATLIGYVNARGATIGEFFYLRETVIAGGEFEAGGTRRAAFYAPYSKVGNELDFTGSRITAARTDASSLDGDSINLRQAVIAGNATLEKFVAMGKVFAYGCSVGGTLRIDTTKIYHGGARTVDLRYSAINILRPSARSRVSGSLGLSQARIETLRVESRKTSGNKINHLPPLSDAKGWRIGAIRGYIGADRKLAQSWLSTIPVGGSRKKLSFGWVEGPGVPFSAQPWKEFAQAFDASGRHSEAKSLRVKAARLTTSHSKLPTRLVRRVYGIGVGYGYRPLFALVWLAIIWMVVALISGFNPEKFVPLLKSPPTANSSTVLAPPQLTELDGSSGESALAGYPQFIPVLYAADVALPPVSTGQSLAWRPVDTTISFTFALLKGLSWALTALLLAGITGLLKKD